MAKGSENWCLPFLIRLGGSFGLNVVAEVLCVLSVKLLPIVRTEGFFHIIVL